MRFLVACLLIFSISIFPFETTIAGKVPGQSTYYQGEPVATTSEKRPRILKKKKRVRFRRHWDKISDLQTLDGHTVGFMPTPAPYPPEIYILNTTTKTSYAYTIQPGAENNALPHKEQPRPVPYTSTEFILPTLLSIRKENNSQSMD